MLNLDKINESLRGCPCGRKHEVNIRAVEIGENKLQDTGRLLKDAGFAPKLHLAADGNTLRAAPGIEENLRDAGFELSRTVFGNLRSASSEAAERVKADMVREGAQGVISVGTGSLNDICRINAYNMGLNFAIFATAPSMDGFASVMAPITINGFKRTLQAKAPEVIIADTGILAASPDELKAAGLGDLLGKYTAHADWEVAAITTGEYYCDEIAALTRSAVDRAAELTRVGDRHSPEFAGSLMEALVLSGLAMLLSGCTRPASGAEHHLAHFWEMKYALAGLPEVYHGKKVGIAAGMIADVYNRLAKVESVREHRIELDENELSKVFGPLWSEARKENFPNPTDKIPLGTIERRWPELQAALSRVPKGDDIRALLRAAGGAATCAEAGISPELEAQGLRYGRYARFRITMMRLLDIIETDI